MWRHSNGAANLESAIVQELLRNRHFAGLVRQFALPYVRLIKPFGTDFLHGHGFLGAVHQRGHRLRTFGLHGLHTVDSAQCRCIIIAQAVCG